MQKYSLKVDNEMYISGETCKKIFFYLTNLFYTQLKRVVGVI